MTNHDLMNYGYAEGKDFDGLMPKAAEMIGTVGQSEESVHMHGMDVNGVDALEIMDIEKVFE